MKRRFRLGQKVICIDEPESPVISPWVAFPKRGSVYTIRAYRPDDISSVLLHEIVSEIGRDHCEAGFFEDRFRAIDDRETDISAFKALLKSPELIDV